MQKVFTLVGCALGIPSLFLMWMAAFGPPAWLGLSDASEAEAAIHIGYLAGAVTLIAVGVAICAIYAQRQTARAQATLQHLAKMEFDQDFLKAKGMFLEIENRGKLKDYAAREMAHTEEARLIRLYLNHFELVSIGIQHRIIDYHIFRSWNRKTVILVWSVAKPFVVELRKQFDNDKLFLEFEELAKAFDSSRRRRFK